MHLRYIIEWRDAGVWALAMVGGLRVVLGLVMAGAWEAARPFTPAAHHDNPQVYGQLDMPSSFPGDALLGVWVRWDAVHHLNLAQRGYQGVSEGDSVYYPLYVLVTRVFAWLLGGNYILAGLMVSSVACVFAFTCLYRLADLHFGAQAARWAVLAAATYPTAFFLVAPYNESLFLALTAGAFLAAYRRRWWLAGVLGFFASLTRGPGIVTPLALAALAYRQWKLEKPARPEQWWPSLVAGLGLPVLGGLAFLGWRRWMGFGSMTETLNRYSGLVLSDPLSGLLAGLWQWLLVHDLATTLDVWSVLLFAGFAAAMLARPEWRRPEWIVLLAANLAVFTSKQSLVAASMQSAARYVLVLFPAYLILGSWLARQSRLARFVYITASSTGLVVLSMLYTLWIFIG